LTACYGKYKENATLGAYFIPKTTHDVKKISPKLLEKQRSYRTV
jgi:hypothetical protein